MSDLVKMMCLAEFAEAGGDAILEDLMNHPGKAISCWDPGLAPQLAGIVEEGGGWLWVCPECGDFGTLNRVCDCPNPRTSAPQRVKEWLK